VIGRLRGHSCRLQTPSIQNSSIARWPRSPGLPTPRWSGMDSNVQFRAR
jgi:hypothetical protein